MAARLDRLDRRTGSDSSHHGNRDRAAAFVIAAIVRPHAAEIAFDHRGGESAPATALPHRLGHLDDLDGARPVGEAPDEATLLERGDQAVDTRFRAQIERVLHLVERRRHSGLLHPLVDEAEQFELLSRQHYRPSLIGVSPGSVSDSFETNHERTLYVPYLFRNPLIWGEQVEGSQKEAFSRPAGSRHNAPRPWRPARAEREAPGNRQRQGGPASNCPAPQTGSRHSYRRRGARALPADNRRVRHLPSGRVRARPSRSAGPHPRVRAGCGSAATGTAPNRRKPTPD